MTDCTTHGEGCYAWGRKHYECALAEIERLQHMAKVAEQGRQIAVQGLEVLEDVRARAAADRDALLAQVEELRKTLDSANDRICDMYKNDDGQAWKEAERYMKKHGLPT